MDVTAFQSSSFFADLVGDVRRELETLIKSDDVGESALRTEQQNLRAQMEGWGISLADAKLSTALRGQTQANWDAAHARAQEIEQQLTARRRANDCVDQLLSPAKILDRLQRLPEILSSNNPSRCNLELALHIDRIDCDADGQVVMRTCRLGALAEAVPLLRQDAAPVEPETKGDSGGRNGSRRGPRRRRRLRVDSVGADRRELIGTAEFVTDPDRYAGLPESWFWEDVFQKPQKLSWAAEHALEVAKARLNRLTHEELSAKFGKTVPTIRASLEYAAEQDPSIAELLSALPPKMPRAQWHVDHAEEVWAYAEELKIAKGTQVTPMKELVQHFKKSDVTLRKALDVADARRNSASDSAA